MTVFARINPDGDCLGYSDVAYPEDAELEGCVVLELEFEPDADGEFGARKWDGKRSLVPDPEGRAIATQALIKDRILATAARMATVQLAADATKVDFSAELDQLNADMTTLAKAHEDVAVSATLDAAEVVRAIP